ncbi:unnamed protein product [Triticum turgidum subsp. durum]|uniref:Uncharacterized protein n=1 Tax=Triticum turgidum subsp. durum TaxID=4567 RepID=A0A9R0Q5S5_TRITD|nr:unnamed protein product [Triticum turgidum subsp. durum]
MAGTTRLEAGGSDGEYTQDGTTDLHGNPILRSKRGGWRACAFVVVYEVFERMAYYGISSNLVLYLTTELHQGTVLSANNVTNWVGTIWMTPVIGAYIADAHLGRYRTFMVASIIYLLGMILLTMAVSLPSLKPAKCGLGTADPNCDHKATSVQLGVFFLALYILAVGTGGTKPNISTIGADQFDEHEPRERKQKLSFFNCAGTPFYRHKPTSESSFAKMAGVIVAAVRKCRVPAPVDPRGLHEHDPNQYEKKKTSPLPHTPNFRVLSKAAVKIEGGRSASRWSLSTVTQVEETKQMLKMLPVLLITFVPSAMLAQINTLFVKQGTTLERRLHHFEIPPASLQGFVTISMLVSVVLYDCLFVPFMRRLTKNPRGISLLQRMGVGLVFHIVIMVIASVTERHRLRVAMENGIFESKGTTVPLSIFVLLPQFVLMGVADAFLEVAKIEFFYDQAPEGMKSLGTSYSMTSLGIGNFLSSFLLSTVSRVTRRHGQGGWIQNNLNASRLDHYYAFFAVLNCANLFVFFAVCRMYVYNAEVTHVVDGGGGEKQRPEVAMQQPATVVIGNYDAFLDKSLLVSSNVQSSEGTKRKPMDQKARTPSARNKKKGYGRSSSHRTTGRDQTSDA